MPVHSCVQSCWIHCLIPSLVYNQNHISTYMQNSLSSCLMFFIYLKSLVWSSEIVDTVMKLLFDLKCLKRHNKYMYLHSSIYQHENYAVCNHDLLLLRTSGSISIGISSKQGCLKIVIIVEYKRSHWSCEVSKFLITLAKYYKNHSIYVACSPSETKRIDPIYCLQFKYIMRNCKSTLKRRDLDLLLEDGMLHQ